MTLIHRGILAARYRLHPDYRVTPWERLSADEQRRLHCLYADGVLYGILTPKRSGLTMKAIDRATARLCLDLDQPEQVKSNTLALMGANPHEALARLVLDNVLQIESGRRFVSGIEAYPIVFAGESTDVGAGSIGRLSLDALRYAACLHVDDPLALSGRLYRYNTLPASPRWRRRLADETAVAELLEFDRYGNSTELIESSGAERSMGVRNRWFSWRLDPRKEDRHSLPTYKLYVSPDVGVLRDCVRTVFTVISQHQRALGLKIGADVYGLLRPDKFMIYFTESDDMFACATALREELDGMPAQGVPFTAELGADRLLSWGVDPPADQPILDWQGIESWRLWITNRLAGAVSAAKRADSPPVPPWQFALDRLALEGIDPGSWIPFGAAEASVQ